VTISILTAPALALEQTHKPVLHVRELYPLTIRGQSFRSRERVLLTLRVGTQPARKRTVVASRLGTFTARLAVRIPRCATVFVRATGNQHSIATFQLPRSNCVEP
jgi:hypothetical protein